MKGKGQHKMDDGSMMMGKEHPKGMPPKRHGPEMMSKPMPPKNHDADMNKMAKGHDAAPKGGKRGK